MPMALSACWATFSVAQAQQHSRLLHRQKVVALWLYFFIAAAQQRVKQAHIKQQ
jgi:hypothetical protein